MMDEIDHARAQAIRDYLATLPEPTRKAAREALAITLYRSSPEAWARRVLGLTLDRWQQKLVSTPPGGRAIALVHRQAGKTTAAAVATSHALLFGRPGSTSLILAPTQRQSGEAIRRIRGLLLKASAKLEIDNAFSLELDNGSRVLGLPGQDDAAIRGLTVDGVLVVDEAARVADALFQAAQPMVLRHAKVARVVLLSTAWARDGFFYRLWSEGDPRDWTKIEARIDECSHLTPEDIERERRSMPASVFAREYLNQFDAIEYRFFNAGSIAAAFGDVQADTPEDFRGTPIPSSPAPLPSPEPFEVHMNDPAADPLNWRLPAATTLCIGLDIGLAQDRSALVAAGAWRSGARSLIGVFDVRQFPLGAPLDEVAEAAVDLARRHRCRIVFDSSNNSAFASLLAARLGPNLANALVAGVITNALDHASQPVPMMLSLMGLRTAIPRWTLAKRELVESVAAEIDAGTLRIGHAGDWEALRDELLAMERTVRASGSVAYSVHDDMVMALSLAVFGLRRIGAPARSGSRSRERFSSAAWT